MASYAIQAENLNISFNGTQVLYNVSFSLKKGEIHAVVGTNGAGKSTLMKIINGVYKKNSGTIKVFDKVEEYNTPEEARKAGIAMVFQDLSIIPTLTVSENIFLQTYPYRKGILIDDRKSREKAAELLDFLTMKSEINPRKIVGELSLGYQQIVEIAKALSNNPKVLILDEPTASLSNSEIERLFDVMTTLKQKGIAVIYITHYLQDIFKICDSVTLLRDGRKIFTKSIDKLNLQTLINEMVGSEVGSISFNREKGLRVSTPLMELKNVSTHHIRNVSIKLYPGEIVGIAGILGSGRSELMNAIFGIDRILEGKIYMQGKFISIKSTTDAINQGITLVPENRREQGLIVDFSVSDNISMPILKRLKKYIFIDEQKSRNIVSHYIELLNIKIQGLRQIVRYLSGGNQQRVVIAKCLASEPRILLLDDPTFGVDVYAKQEIMKIIKNYVLQGNAILFISSEFKEIAEFCDSIYIMKRGKIANLVTSQASEDDLLYMVQ